MTGMSMEDYQGMMLGGGRSPEGVRSRRERDALAEVAGIAAEIPNAPVSAEDR